MKTETHGARRSWGVTYIRSLKRSDTFVAGYVVLTELIKRISVKYFLIYLESHDESEEMDA